MVNTTTGLKKITLTGILCVTAIFLSVFSLKSTSFQRIETNNKVTIAMNPVYSEGDPIPDAIAQAPRPKPIYDNLNGTFKNLPQKLANSQPISIIPNYIPERKLFIRKHTVAVNSYLKNRTYPYQHGAVAYQGAIPTQGTKYLKPAQPSVPIYKEYVSLMR